jgi:broad specificity phosphatase PhoE
MSRRAAPDQTGRLILVRHGESEGNRDRRFTHSTEVPLTDNGRAQARAAATRLQARWSPQRVIASPFARARETGAVIAATLGVPMEIDAELREQNLGLLAGQPYDVVRNDPTFDLARPWEWRPPGGESLVDVAARVSSALDRLARAHAGREIVLVTHAGVIQAVWAYISGSWTEAPVTPNAGIVLVEHRAGLYSCPTRIEED